LISIDVSIHVWDSETNDDLSGAVVSINGTNYSVPFGTFFAPGTVLRMLAFASGYMDENRTVIVEDTSRFGNSTQSITFLSSANLVRYLGFCFLKKYKTYHA
jgi:hypothetical protein